MKKQKVKKKIVLTDYIKAVKKADREIQLSQSAGWQRITKIHTSKKAYNRKRKEKSLGEE